jgi:hypothetical protein
MSWAKVDDRANEHPKFIKAGPKAAWLWTCGLMYCNRQPKKTGRIPKAVLPMLFPGLGKREAEALVRVGLWEDDGEDYAVHDYHPWNPELREKRAEAGRLGGKRSGEARAVSEDAEDGSKNEATCFDVLPDDEAKTKQLASEHEANARSKPAGARVTRVDPPHPTTTPPPRLLPQSGQSQQSSPPSDGRVPCPVPLPVPAATLDGMTIAVGIPRKVAEANIQAWATMQSGDQGETRPLGAWVKCAVVAVQSKWSDSSRRAEMRDLAEPKPEPVQNAPERVVRAADALRDIYGDENAKAPPRRAGNEVPR